MKRTIKKQIWLNREEAEQLRKKSRKACLTEAGLLRFLLKGYYPKEKPGDDFYTAMNEMRAISEGISALRAASTVKGGLDDKLLQKEIDRWHCFQASIELKYLTPDESALKWQ